MKFISPALSKIARLRQKNIEEWIDLPILTQENVLEQLIFHGQYSVFGKKHKLSKVHTLKEFKKAIPIQQYEDLKPYIERLMLGEQYLLWDTPVKWFAKSSGTTNDKSKFIPITEENLKDCHYKASKDVLSLYYKNFPDSDLLTGKGLLIGGSHQIHSINKDAFYGDLSAVLFQNLPVWAHWLKTPDISIAIMDEWEEKIEKMAHYTIQENVSSISGVPTWTLVLIKRILDIAKKEKLIEVWPNLELYMHGGVAFTPYKEQFNKLIGKPITYFNMYNASEGFFAAQSNPMDDSMLLFLNYGIFFEFMPLEELTSANPSTIGLEEVEIGKNYALVITTNSGLWRYLLGDTIVFTQKYPFKIEVSGRTKHFINAFGEEIIVDNAEKAIATAAQKTDAIVTDYTAAPVYFGEKNNGAHEWIIEFEKLPANIEVFTEILDSTLKNINSDYEAKRYKNIALAMPVVRVAEKSIFTKWLKSKNKLGGQHKVPRLSNDRKIVEELLAMQTPK